MPPPDATYVLTALPRSAAADAPAHVSVHVSPRITRDGTLGDFPPFRDWTRAATRGTLTLADQTGEPFATTPVRAARPDLWPRVFPPDTVVRAFEPRTVQPQDWHSFPAAKIERLTKLVHLSALSDDAVSPATADCNRVLNALSRRARQLLGADGDETALTAYLERGDVEPDGVDGALYDLYRARRFYERPESAQRYERHPAKGAVNARPAALTGPDFHQRVALLGDQPAALRALGLVLDVRVEDVARLAAATWLTATLVPDGAPDGTLPTRVACRAPRDGTLVVPSRRTDWLDGALRLGDTARFSVLDLDPDASALKLERFLGSGFRLRAAAERNEPADAAPPALRAHGFAITRNGHLEELAAHATEHQARAAALGGAEPPLLHAEDVTRGLRLDVWDDAAQRWFSLHRRSNDLRIGGALLSVEDEEGFLQGATAQQTPPSRTANGAAPQTYLHETIAGWSGWSLSAPHPCRTQEFDYAAAAKDSADVERLTDRDPPPDPVTGVVSEVRVVPGSLPRLRYGRRYAFRAWSVDLAGNSPGRGAGTPDGKASHASGAAPDRRPGTEPAPRVAADDPYPGLSVQLSEWGVPRRAETAPKCGEIPVPFDDDEIGQWSDTLGERSGFAADRYPERVRALDAIRAAVDAERRRRPPGGAAAGPAEDLRTTFRKGLGKSGPAPSVPAPWTAERLGPLAAGGTLTADDLLQTVTPLQTLQRWHPVEPPVLIPRRPYREGESVHHLVIRSGVDVERDPRAGDSITVVDPATYAARTRAAGYFPTCERHIAPPKVSQFEAELHGRFDDAIGADGTAAHRTALLRARRESGSFLDRTIPDLAEPGRVHHLDYVRLAAGPGTDPRQLADLDTLRPGAPLAPGQYVVHDVEQARLPYLPDPLAVGFSVLFPDGSGAALPHGFEGPTTRFTGTWPELRPYRLVLSAGPAIRGRIDVDARGHRAGPVVTLELPPGADVRARVTTAIDTASLPLFGVWQLLPDALRADTELADAVATGWSWAFTPAEEVRLVHAVPRPLRAPKPVALAEFRGFEETGVTLVGVVDVHGASTARLDAEAEWDELVDDVAQPRPASRHWRTTAFSHEVAPEADTILYYGRRPFDRPARDVRPHVGRHELGDTRHREITYRFRGSTRFAEYFPPSLMADVEQRSVVGPAHTLCVPSSAAPPKPVVAQVLPLFRWDETAAADQPFAARRSRRTGLRIYLARPWNASGDGELLGVLVGRGAPDPTAPYTSQWAADPAWRGPGPRTRTIDVELDHLLPGVETSGQEARPAVPGATVRLPQADRPEVTVLGYRPRFDEERGLWCVDVAIDPGAVQWPFVRLAVARYQPHSLRDCEVSLPVTLDYVQLPPERTLTVDRPDERRVRVSVSGVFGHREAGPGADAEAGVTAARRVRARLEQRTRDVATDLGWTTIDAVDTRLRSWKESSWTGAWTGEIRLPRSVPVRRPGEGADLRVTVEEFELLPRLSADDPPDVVAPRVVYVDHCTI